MARFALIGNPVSHSISPRLFAAGYDGRYPYELVETEDFDAAWRVFLRSYDAVNVTAPFKETAFEKAKIRSREAELCGAANILVKTSKGVSAWNSDCTGVAAMLRRLYDGNVTFAGGGNPCNSACCGRTALVVGAGGAGKAAAVAALSCGMRVTVINRSLDKALSFAHYLAARSRTAASLPGASLPPLTVLPVSQFSKAFVEADTIIYTASAPLWENGTDGLHDLLAEAASLSADRAASTPRFIIEANYRTPSFDAQTLAGLCPGTRLITGETWLLMQALTGYPLMTGRNPDYSAMEALPGVTGL